MRRAPTRERRWRVYVKGQFACVVHAATAERAIIAAKSLIEVRESRDG